MGGEDGVQTGGGGREGGELFEGEVGEGVVGGGFVGVDQGDEEGGEFGGWFK